MATIIGVIAAGAMFFFAIYQGTGGNYKLFLDVHGILIVIGGTLASTFIGYPLNEVLKVFRAALLVFAKEKFQFEHYINEITQLAKQVREVKSYESIDMSKIKNPFFKDGIQMLKDGIHTSEEIREILETRISYIQNRENAEARIFATMGRLAPAFGLVGTLIGLIDMLQKMGSDNSKMGQGMSVALVATFYGVVTSNLIYQPIAEKLMRRTEEDVIFKMMIVEGIVLLNEFQHPFVVEDRLNSFVPLKKRQDSTSLEGFHISFEGEQSQEKEKGE